MNGDQREAWEASQKKWENEPKKKSGATGCVIGCLLGLALFLVLLLALVYFIAQNWQRWAGGFAAGVITEAIEDSQLPPQEKAELKAELDRLAEKFQTGEISNRQLAGIIDEFSESPLLTTFVAAAVDAQYIEQSGLDEQEKAEARQTLRRFVHGVMQRQISDQQIDEAMVHVADREAGGEWRLREQVTDEQLREFLATAKEKADEAGVPQDIPEVDPSDELRRIIDQGLARGQPPVPAPVEEGPAEPVQPQAPPPAE